MIFVEIVYNILTLIAVSIFAGLIKKEGRPSWLYQGWQGVIFGLAAVLGMLRPLVFAPGVIFDGRSVMVSLCGLFFGPLAAVIAGGMAVLCRILQGGAGAFTGVLVVLSSAGLGVIFYMLSRRGWKMTLPKLWIFGLLVHMAMLLLMLTLPADMASAVLKRMSFSVLLVYPLATVFIGKILLSISEYRQKEEAFRESSAMLDLILNTVPQSIFWKDPQGRYLGCNRVFAAAVGLAEPSQIIGKTEFDLPWPRKEAEAYRADDREVLEKNQPKLHIVEPLQRADGSRIWIDTSKAPLCDASGRPFAVLGVYEDITKRKQAEEGLRESERKLKQAQELAHLGYWHWEVKTGKVEWSAEVYRIFGLDPREFTPHIDSILALSPWPEENLRGRELIQKAMESHVPGSYEQRFLRPDKSIGYYRSTFEGKYDDGGNLVAIFGTVHDITERKRAEEEAFQMAREWRVTFDSSNDAIFILDPQQRVVRANKTAERFFQRSNAAMCGRYCWEIVHGSSEPHPQCPVIRARESGQREMMELRSGDRYFEVIVDPILDAGGRYAGSVHIVSDITERKLAEDVIRDSEERYRQLFAGAAEGIVFADATTKALLYANPAFCKMFGRSEEEMTSLGIEALHPKEHILRAFADFEALARGEKEVVLNLPCVRKSGTLFYADVRTSRVFIAGRSMLVGFFVDTTERLRAEEALRESEERFRAISESSMAGIYIVQDGIIKYVNPAMCNALGYRREDLLGASPLKAVHPEDQVLLLENIRRRLEGDQVPLRYEVRFVRKDGMVLYFELMGVRIEYAGRPAVSGTLLDITERKLFEQSLCDYQARLEVAEALSRMGSWEWNPSTGISHWSPEMFRLFHCDPDKGVPTIPEFAEWIHPDDRAGVLEMGERLVRSGDMVRLEFRSRPSSGKIRYFSVVANAIKAPAGETLRVVGAVQEITEYKRAEEALRIKNMVFDSSMAANSIAGVDGVLTEVNDSFLRLWGLRDKSEAVGKHLSSFFKDPDDAAPIVAALQHSGQCEGDFLARRNNGTTFIANFQATIVRDAKGAVIGYQAAILDFTERRKGELALRQSEERFAKAFNSSPVPIAITEFKTGRFLDVNEQWLKLVGYSREELLDRTTREMGIVSDWPLREKLVAELQEKRTLKDVPYQIRTKSGELRDVLWSMEAINIEGREAILSLLQDITERKKAENEIRRMQQQFSDIIEFLPDATFVIDKDGKVIAWNKAIEEMTGVPKARMLGRTNNDYSVLFYEEVRPILIDLVLQRDQEIKVKYPFLQWDGNAVRAESFVPKLHNGQGAFCWGAATKLFDNNGNLIGAIESIRDITKRKEAEEAIRKSEERYRLLNENMTDALWTMDFNGQFTFVNPPLTRLVGYSAEELMRMGLRSYLAPESAARAEDVFKKEMVAAATQGHDPSWTVLLELEVVRKDGKKILCEVKATFLRDGSNQAIGIIGVTRDITERKAVEKTQRLAQLGKLVADMAHEVNNPLMIISGNAQLSLMPDVALQDIRESLQIIVEECDRAKTIIQRLLQFSRPSTGQLQETDINSCVDNVVELLQHQFEITDVRIEKDYASGLPRVLVDDKQIQEVVVNLLNNAREALSAGGVILVRTSLAGESVRVDIKDSGRGMTADLQGKIFEPFFTTKEKGSGLGLSVCFGIIKAHKGELLCESVVGQGTTMSILLPVLRKG